MDNIVIEDGTIKREIHNLINKFSDDTKKDLISTTKQDTVIIFKDKDGTVYPDGKIIVSDKFVTLYNYEYDKDSDGNVVSCRIKKSTSKNGKSIDIEKTTSTEYYDKSGKLKAKEFYTRDGITYLRQRYEYGSDNNLVSRKDKSTHTEQIVSYNLNGDITSIVGKTIKSKLTYDKYKAYYDNENRVYKTIDCDKRIETDYEREFDGDNNILSQTKRFFDITGTKKKLISYITETYNPASGYKIDSIIKNGILTEKHEYDLKGEELGMYALEDGKELFKRVEKSIDSDTGNKTTLTTIKITEQCSGKVIKDSFIKTVHDKDNKLLSYSDNDSVVSTYIYDEENRRKNVITKKLVGEEYIKINEINYEYSTDEESGKTEKTRTLIIYDKDGNKTNKQVQTEIIDKTTEQYNYDKTEFEVVSDEG